VPAARYGREVVDFRQHLCCVQCLQDAEAERRRADAAAGKREPDHIGVLVRPEDRPPAEVLAFLLGRDLTLQGPIQGTQRDSAALAGDQSGTTSVNDADFCFTDFLEFIWFAEMMALAGSVRSTAVRHGTLPASRSLGRGQNRRNHRLRGPTRAGYRSRPSSSPIIRSITESPPCQNAGSRASRPKGARSSE